MSDPVREYIQNAPPGLQPTLNELHEMITAALPDAEQAVESGFPVFKIGGQWAAGFAFRKKGAMLYIMAPGVLDRHDSSLGRLRSGRSCVEFRESKGLSLPQLRELACRMLSEVPAAMRG